jgi:hypothetical protein
MTKLMADVDAETRRLAKVLDHPVRARIIELLGERGQMGWKELSLELGVRTGGLYHHIDTLEGLVARDSSRKYSLTKSGRMVFNRVSQGHTIDSLRRAAVDLRGADRNRRLLESVFAPRALIAWATSTSARAAIALVSLSIALTAFAVATGSVPRLYYFQSGGTPALAAIGLLGSLVALVAFSYASTTMIFKSNANLLSIATASALSFIPVLAFTAVSMLSPLPGFFASAKTAYTLCLVLFQAWSAALLGAGISVVSGIRIERSVLVSLVVLYSTMVLLFI